MDDLNKQIHRGRVKLVYTGCSCCDPTHDSPDPVVVRLEMEVERHLRECEARGARIAELDVDVARLRGLLREACDMARADDDPERWYGNEITDEWFDRAALEGKP